MNKSDFINLTLNKYSSETQTNFRSREDLSPFKKWLIDELYKAKETNIKELREYLKHS